MLWVHRGALGTRSNLITYLYSSLFDSPAQTLVNTVNTIGVMGKGVAKVFRETYPKMFREYKRVCDAKQLEIGKLHLWKSEDRWVLNVPTKTTWRLPSQIDYVEAGLETFVANYARLGISSVSFPPLGCGNGNLEWDKVRPLMESYLKSVHIPVYIHNWQVKDDFVPEHLSQEPPNDFSDFWEDILAAIAESSGKFVTSDRGAAFTVRVDLDRSLHIKHEGGKGELLKFEELETAWVAMRDGILSIDRYPDEKSRRYKSYLFPIFASLPYVRSAPVSRVGEYGRHPSKGLFFKRGFGASSVPSEAQGCLSL